MSGNHVYHKEVVVHNHFHELQQKQGKTRPFGKGKSKRAQQRKKRREFSDKYKKLSEESDASSEYSSRSSSSSSSHGSKDSHHSTHSDDESHHSRRRFPITIEESHKALNRHESDSASAHSEGYQTPRGKRRNAVHQFLDSYDKSVARSKEQWDKLRETTPFRVSARAGDKLRNGAGRVLIATSFGGGAAAGAASTMTRGLAAGATVNAQQIHNAMERGGDGMSKEAHHNRSHHHDRSETSFSMPVPIDGSRAWERDQSTEKPVIPYGSSSENSVSSDGDVSQLRGRA